MVEATVSPGFQGHQPPVSSLQCSTPPPNVITRCQVSPWETRCFSLFCAFCLGCCPSLDQLLTCPTPYPLCDLWTNSYSLHASVPQSRKWEPRMVPPSEWWKMMSGRSLEPCLAHSGGSAPHYHSHSRRISQREVARSQHTL